MNYWSGLYPVDT
jgi:hypothetical protein